MHDQSLAQPTPFAAIEKDIRRNGREWDVYVGGEFVGTRQFKFEAEALADEVAYTLLRDEVLR